MKFATNIKDIGEKEKKAYIEKVKEANGGSLEGIENITVTLNDDGSVDINTDNQSFERIRRITGLTDC
jgi:hypothetical protein